MVARPNFYFACPNKSLIELAALAFVVERRAALLYVGPRMRWVRLP